MMWAQCIYFLFQLSDSSPNMWVACHKMLLRIEMRTFSLSAELKKSIQFTTKPLENP